MTRAEIEAALRAAGIEEYREEAKRLFCHFSGMSRAAALAEPGAVCTAPALLAAVRRRAAREPLAYILEEAWFFEERYRVTPDCLIPRPETELLVEHAIGALPQGGRFADLCTGSGCIAISLLAHRQDLTGVACDISAAALRLAAENAAANGVADRLTLYRADLLREESLVGSPFDAILSNPPYVTEREWAAVAPELHHEPLNAFLGGEDGLVFYRRLIGQFTDAIRPGGFFLFEIGAGQGEALLALADAAGLDGQILRDLGGHDRMALLRRRAE